MKQRQIHSLQKVFVFFEVKSKEMIMIHMWKRVQPKDIIDDCLYHFIINDIITNLPFHFGMNTIVSYVQLINTIFIIFEISKLGL